MNKKKRFKRMLIAFISIVLFLVLLYSFFAIGEKKALGFERFVPDYEKTDISDLLSKQVRSDEDYEILYAQTGLTAIGIEGVLERDGIEGVLKIQDFFFKELEVRDTVFGPFCHYYSLYEKASIAPLKNGDLIISSATEFSWWSLGHCAMVVDAERGIVVEAIGYGSTSTTGTVSALLNRGDIMVLRPNIDEETVNKIVDYVYNELMDIPYDATIGVLSQKYNEEIPYTQCAHIFWFAFMQFGYDIDSNGGGVVTPQNIANSEYFDIVQICGINPYELWK